MSPRKLLPTLVFTAAALVLSACNGGGDGAASPTPMEETRFVISDDGRLTLEIPPGAASQDVQINITSVPLDDLPEELRVLQGAGDGYRLEPDGLEFSEPVAVSLDLIAGELEGQPESGAAAYGLVSLTSDGERELLEGLVTEARLGESRVVVRGELSHFSFLGRTRGSLTVSLEDVQREQPVGATFSAQAAAGNSDRSGTVRLRGIAGEFTALGGASLIEVENGDDAESPNGFFSPPDALIELDQGIGATGRFRCDSPGFSTYGVNVDAESVVEVDGEELTTPLTVLIDAVIRCVE
jgi:hypothetical protein